jgi:hypothetical protein
VLTPYNLVVFIVGVLFLVGLGTFIAGILTMTLRAPSSSDVKNLVKQTAQLAQKGIAEDVAGLVGNASQLLDAMDQLVRTTRGVGMFLMILGMIIMAFACWIAIQVYKMQL